MKRRTLLNVLCTSLIMLVTACIPLAPRVDATATQAALDQSATQTAAAIPTDPIPTATLPNEPTPPELSSLTPTQAPVTGQQFLAYINNGQLLVTDVTNGVKGGTTQYTLEGETDQVTELAWSPSGEFVAFVSVASGEPELFYTFALGQGSPMPLGQGTAPSWSPDSQSIAYISGILPDENIWVTTIANPAPRQLTFETNYAWGRPVFTPDGQSLIVTGTDRNNMGAQGNTTFILQSLVLDGSGTRTSLRGATPFEGARLPNDLRFSPDGSRLAFSTSFHLSACASPGAYYVSSADGSNLQEIVSPSLKPVIDSNQEHYHVGLSYAWTPAGDGLLALGNVIDCNINSATMGQVLAGPQMSIIGLDGTERMVVPGFFYGLSFDRTGALIAAAHFQGGFQDPNPIVEIYSAQTGQPVLSLGAASSPQFQP